MSLENRDVPFFTSTILRVPYFAIGADLAIRDYIIYSRQLVEEFGEIIAWEKEDKVEPGKPNAAGWILPSYHNVHRRYPEVAILIPDTVGRACGGLCASCQRMYYFQNGNLNFNLDKLKPKETWSERLKKLLAYFENDSQLRDILITGGDGLMSSNKSLKNINDISVLTYYTFSVKGYMENYHNFATNERAVQEQLEEKVLGIIPAEYNVRIQQFPMQAENMQENINELRNELGVPFLATDRNVLNLPGVGKSLTFRVIGITRYGRRILEFDHDRTRNHSPIINKMGKMVIIESKSISEYLDQLEDMGENRDDYQGIYGYSIGETEPRQKIYEYPEYHFRLTKEMTNLEV